MSTWLPRLDQERHLADGAYGSCQGCVAPYPKNRREAAAVDEAYARGLNYRNDDSIALTESENRYNHYHTWYRARAEHAVRDIVVPHHIYRTDMRMRIDHRDDDTCRCHMCLITRFIVNKVALWRRVRGPIGQYRQSLCGPWSHFPA
jgi:hypothetical protein